MIRMIFYTRSTLYEYVKVINEQDADYIYCDEATFKREQHQ